MNICKTCNKEHDGNYGSGIFCSDHCRRVWIGRQRIEKAKADGSFNDMMKKMRSNLKYERRRYDNWVCKYCGYIAKTRRSLDDHIIEVGHRDKYKGKIIDNKDWFNSFQEGATRGREKNIKRIKAKYEEIRENTPTEKLSDKQRKIKILDKYGHKCGICGIGDVWNGKYLKLQIHHIDGDHKNNIEDNLIAVCPNCHSQTDNYMARNKTKHIKFPSDDIVLEIWKKSRSIKHCIEQIGKHPTSQNYRKVREILDKNGIEYQLKNG